MEWNFMESWNGFMEGVSSVSRKLFCKLSENIVGCLILQASHNVTCSMWYCSVDKILCVGNVLWCKRNKRK